jgi:uncharacterized membrane protein
VEVVAVAWDHALTGVAVAVAVAVAFAVVFAVVVLAAVVASHGRGRVDSGRRVLFGSGMGVRC